MASPAFITATITGSMGGTGVILVVLLVAASNAPAVDPISFHAISPCIVPASQVFNDCRMSRPLCPSYSLINITAHVLFSGILHPLSVNAGRARVVLINQCCPDRERLGTPCVG